MTRIAVIPGDGIGIEVTREAVETLRAAALASGRPLYLETLPYGADHFLKTGETLPDAALDSLRSYDAILLGALGDPRVPDNRHAADILLGIRFKLDLYINQRPVRLLADHLTPLKGRTTRDIDFVVFRENTEGLYVGMGGIFKKGTPDEIAIQEDVNTRKGVERIIRHAFEHARARGRRRVLMSDKSNALTYGHDLWQRAFRDVARDYNGIEASHMYVDALAMQMVKDPAQFEVIVTCNMFGDILSDPAPGEDRTLRARAWLRAQACRQECRESDGRGPFGRHDAGGGRAGRRGASRGAGGRRLHPRGAHDTRHGGRSGDA